MSGVVYLFGSRVKNNHHPFSDVDLLLEFKLTPEEKVILVERS